MKKLPYWISRINGDKKICLRISAMFITQKCLDIQKIEWRYLGISWYIVGGLTIVRTLGEPPLDRLTVGGRVIAAAAFETEPEPHWSITQRQNEIEREGKKRNRTRWVISSYNPLLVGRRLIAAATFETKPEQNWSIASHSAKLREIKGGKETK